MAEKYILLIDESGDQGLNRVMTHESSFGSSSYLTMGAVLIPRKYSNDYCIILNEIRDTVSTSQLHCTDMSHAQVSYLAKKIETLRLLCFGVISKKSTLGGYKELISGENQAHDYYNKCCQYLFELVGNFMAEKKISSEDISIVFEKKRGHDYGRLERYLKAIADKPQDPRAAKLTYLQPFSIDAKEKDEEPLLALADLVAYSLHKAFCSENNRLRLTEQRYLREIKGKFFCCKDSLKIANFGIKFVKGPVSMGLAGKDLDFAMKFYKAS
jgi:Protein of unknown function (DUF3800)